MRLLLLIVSGDHIYLQDYQELLRFHEAHNALLTISSMPVPAQEAHRFGMMRVDESHRITGFIEQPEESPSGLGSLGVYVFDTASLLQLLENVNREPDAGYDFGQDIVPRVVESGRAYAYPYPGYWLDPSTLGTYYEAHMRLLSDDPGIVLDDPDWVLHTRSPEKPPARIRQPGQVFDSLVSDGCVIEGEVFHSVLSPGVRVEPSAVVRDSVILNDTVIGAGAVVEGCVLDEEIRVGANAQIGVGDVMTLHRTNSCLTFST